MSAARDGGDLVGKVLADTGQRVEVFAVGQHVGDVTRQLADDARRAPVGTHPERVGAFDFEQIGNLVELAGDFGVDQRHKTGRAYLRSIWGTAAYIAWKCRRRALTCVNGASLARD